MADAVAAVERMPLLQKSIEEAPSPFPDPWDWTVEQVVFELTDPQSSLLRLTGPLALPDPYQLAQVLRQNDVNGLALLTEVNTTSIKEELGIKSLAHRASINVLVRSLQHRSPKYRENHPISGGPSSISVESRATSFVGGQQDYDPRATSRGPLAYYQPYPPQFYTHTAPWTNGIKLQGPVQCPPTSPKAPTEEASSTVRQTPHLLLPSQEREQEVKTTISTCDEENRSEIDMLPSGPNDIFEQVNRQGRQNETTIIDSTGKKRRRLVLSQTANTGEAAPETPDLDHLQVSLNIPDTLENDRISGSHAQGENGSMLTPPVRAHGVQQTQSGTQGGITDMAIQKSCPDIESPLSKPGVLVIDQQGKKRMRPILLSHQPLDSESNLTKVLPAESGKIGSAQGRHSIGMPEPTIFDKQRAFGRRAERRRDQVYLGLTCVPVDNLFYGNLSLGSSAAQNSDSMIDKVNFHTALGQSSSCGLSLYVNARMKYFLQSHHLRFDRGGKKHIGIVPYPSRFGEKHRILSLTVFSGSPCGILATRSDRATWVESSGNTTSSMFNVSHNAESNLARFDDDDLELKALEKWKFQEDDEVLPVYGESDSEGEYDLDTWREMEQERGELSRLLKPSKNQKLGSKEVDEAIGCAITQIVQDWTLKREPKLGLKAYRLWVRARHDGTTQMQIEASRLELTKLDHRISSLRKEIAGEEWSKAEQLTRQCKILQPSVFDREDCKWKIATLETKVDIERPPSSLEKRHSIKPKILKQALNEDEENIESDHSDSYEYSDDDLDGFIVQDDIDVTEHQLDIAGSLAGAPNASYVDTAVAAEDNDMVPQQLPHLKKELATPRKQELLVKIPPLSSGKDGIIDLTRSSSDVIEPDMSNVKPRFEPDYSIKTPPLLPSGDESDFFQQTRRKKAVFKKPPISKPTNVINLESDSAHSSSAESPSVTKKAFPTISDVEAIRVMNPRLLVERQDRKRLLVYLISHLPSANHEKLRRYVLGASFEECRLETRNALNALRAYRERLKDVDEETSFAIMVLATLLVSWTIPVMMGKGIRIKHIGITLNDEHGFKPFHEVLLDCFQHYRNERSPSQDATRKDRSVIRGDPRQYLSHNPGKKRKLGVHESQETLEKRKAAQDRMRLDQERRRERELEPRLNVLWSNTRGSSQIIVNPGRRDDQDAIYLNPKFGNGAHIKAHQVEGLQFLWREITADHKDLQGCLLAQTMGLGKTMQVIALLVTIAEAANSPSSNVRQQVPPGLHECRTLIICPPALLENWWDEFIIWAPKPIVDTIGELRKLNTSLSLPDRLIEIQAWSEGGGVLLIGYDAFRTMIHNSGRQDKKSGTTGPPPLNEDQHREVKHALLNISSIVIADEAHQFKTKNSKINSAMKQLSTKSRIALTGSPLSNNLEEYYTLIDWISPNYLGTPTDFREIYEKPIRDGLYVDSTYSQYRESRKTLKALEIEMGPKFHRADVSVLHSDLQGKTEFVIRVALTQLQKDIYSTAIRAMRPAIGQDETRQASLWTWLSILQLLCNHPKCFRDRILTTQTNVSLQGSKGLSRRSTSILNNMDDTFGSFDDDDILLTDPLTMGTLANVTAESEKIFEILTEPIENVNLSNKMLILMQILKLCGDIHDKVLVFSHRIATLDYIEDRLLRENVKLARIDGKSAPQARQKITKDFNEGNINVCLVSTKAGGTGLNMFGANRVVILDESWNPMWERQAIGRAYRIGQKKPVYVYRLTVAGTFEVEVQNQSLFKEQLADRVVDQKNANRVASKKAGDYLYDPKPVEPELVDGFLGKDTSVLDRLLADKE